MNHGKKQIGKLSYSGDYNLNVQNNDEPVLEVKDLHTYFYDDDDVVWKVLEGVNFKIYRGETLGIIGPSGVGKSVLALSILNLIRYPGKIEKGEILYKGKNLLQIEEEIFNEMRGKEIGLVMQNSANGFDPLRDMTFSTSQPYRAHSDKDIQRSEIKIMVIDQLGKVAVSDPSRTADKFAHQMSGGESQRVKIATALMNNPELLIADEPIANLDATIARQILDLLIKMKEKFHLTMIFIAHNIGAIAEIADFVAVMYAGKVVEIGNVETIFYDSRHPFTQGLFYASPSIAPRGKLRVIPGNEPDPRNYPKGCHFHPRCSYAITKCSLEEPELIEYNKRHCVACWRVDIIPKFEADL